MPMPLMTFTVPPLVTPGPTLTPAALGGLLVLILALPCTLLVTLGLKLPTVAMLTLLVALAPPTGLIPMLPVVVGARMLVIGDAGKPLDDTAEVGAAGTPPSALPAVESFLDSGLGGVPPGMGAPATTAWDEWWCPW